MSNTMQAVLLTGHSGLDALDCRAVVPMPQPKAGVNIVGGRIKLPQGPGLGITPDKGQFSAPVLSFG